MIVDRAENTGLRRRAKRLVLAGLTLLLIVLVVRWLLPTPAEQLARIDAARAVPDDQNAALLYAELLRGEELPPTVTELSTAIAPILEATLDPVSLLESGMSDRKLVALELPEGLLDPNDDVTLRKPWTSAAYPQLRQWLDTHQDRIDRLLQAAQKPSCHFPLSSTPGHMTLFDMPLGAFRQNVFILRRAANNDMAEGDIAAALTKYQALVAMGHHLKTQPAPLVLTMGIALEALGLHHQIEFVATGPATDQHLDELAADVGDLESHWPSLRQDITHVRNLFSRTLEDRRRFAVRIAMSYYKIRYKDEGWLVDHSSELYHRLLSEKRALHILIALRRQYNRTGHWPQKLEEIAASLPPLALIDPHNNGPYVYKLTDDGFQLYSTGPNAQDEGGRHHQDDDWPIWPPRGPVNKPEPQDPNDVQRGDRTIEKGKP